VFRCGAATRLSVTKSTTGTADTQTQAAWIIDPGKNALGILQVSQGVR
jgi:hypothetical protein